jgi:hypothetical protein
LERLRFSLALALLLALPVAFAACGNSDPDPATVLDRALTPEHLSGFGSGSGGVVAVQALGYEDRVLDERKVEASPAVMGQIRDALGADNGLRTLVGDLHYEGTETVGGVETDHISGDLDVTGLAKALKQAGGGEVGKIAGVAAGTDLEDSLSAADFDLFADAESGATRRLDLTLSLDDPDNALPPTRIRFSLTPDSSGDTLR